MNLTSNAFKFTQQGGIKIIVTKEIVEKAIDHPEPSSNNKKTLRKSSKKSHISYFSSNKPRSIHIDRKFLSKTINQLRFTIKDTGEGMKETEIFPLQPLHIIYNRKKAIGMEGFGFGLRISQQLVQKLGGEIDIKSKGTGTAVTFTVSESDFKEIENKFLGAKEEIKINGRLMSNVSNIPRRQFPIMVQSEYEPSRKLSDKATDVVCDDRISKSLIKIFPHQTSRFDLKY
mmetsp:Transcript_32111/g.28466  ORF Transcript_32111/g.28466 Transcript_32111/m.28466 type:complete len:230 (-) Transcript_32111:33-722(-)